MSTVPSSASAVKGLEYDSRDAGSLKEAGNQAFAKGNLQQAYTWSQYTPENANIFPWNSSFGQLTAVIAAPAYPPVTAKAAIKDILLYSNALQLGDSGRDSIAKSASFKSTVLTNRALVLFKQGKAEECAADCSTALELDPGRVKAYFRRALAREQLGDDANALRDARRVLELDPGNKDAVTAAMRLKDKVYKANEEMCATRQTLDALREVAGKVEGLGKQPGKGTGQASMKDEEYSQVLLNLGILVTRESSAAIQLLRVGGMAPLLTCIKAADHLPETAKGALRALGAAAEHKAFGVELLKTRGAEVLTELATILEVEAPRPSRDDDIVVFTLAAAVHLLQWDNEVVADYLEDLSDVNREKVEKAGKDIADAAVKLLSNSLRLSGKEVFDKALEALVQWCTPGAESSDSSKGSDDAGLPAKEAYLKRQKSHRRKLRGSLWLRDKGMALLFSPVLVSLYKALSIENHMERKKTSGCLSRIIRAVTSVQANEAEREADSARIKDTVRPLLGFHEEAGGSDARNIKAEGEMLAVISSESRRQGTIRRVATATAMAIAEEALGSWAMTLPGFLAEAMTLAASGDELGQSVAAESFSAAASFKGGRGILGPVVETGVLFALMESRSEVARSAAASAYAKLGMIASAFTSDSDDVTKLLNVSLDLIAPEKSKGYHSAGAAVEATMSLDKKAVTDSEYAVEVLNFLASKTKVKEELCYGSARCPKALPRLCQAAQSLDGTSCLAFGLASIFCLLCSSSEEETKESFRNKEITYEQYLQLKELHNKHFEGGKEDETDIKDTNAAVRRRSLALVEAGVVLALKKIAEGASPATMERIALCFRRLATEPANRGFIIQQGGLTRLIDMASVPKSKPGKKGKKGGHGKQETGMGYLTEARHAIAKTLITTNPHLLTESQTMGCVPALIAMCKDHDSLNLQQFEGLMALTNLASMDDVRSRIVAERGIACFQFLQYSSHEMVRRAATEAMCNLMVHPKMVDHMKATDTLKYWAALAKLGSEDPPTAAAALGGLANALRDTDVAREFMSDGVDGCEGLVWALLSAAPDIPNAEDLIHRAAVAVKCIAKEPSLRPLLLLRGVADALTEALRFLKTSEGTGAAAPAEACSDALDILMEEVAKSSAGGKGSAA